MAEYKDKYLAPQPRERDCGVWHDTIEEAITHAERNLNCSRIRMQPYRGTTPQNQGVVVGWALSARKRWRLDYSNTPGINGEPPKWVHVNEENFDAPPGWQRIVHRVNNMRFDQVGLYYRKWSSRFNSPWNS
jgi:hypothetical protein